MRPASALDPDARELLVDGIRRFCRDRRADTACENRDLACEARNDWQQLAQHGWLALGLPESCGGSGAMLGDLALLLQAAGEAGLALPLAECLGEGSGALLAARAGDERDRLLARIASGDAIAGIVELHSIPEPDGSSFRITGTGRFLPMAESWTHMLAIAENDTADSALYVIDTAARGVHLTNYIALDGRPASDVSLKSAAAIRVPAGPGVFKAARQRGELLGASEIVGIVHAALEITRRYLGQRRQYGRPILEFQAIQHRLVELYVGMRELSALLEVAHVAYDGRLPDFDRLVSKVRAQASLIGRKVTQQAIQLHGGMGMTAEIPAGGLYKRVMQIDSRYGSHATALDHLAGTLDLQGRDA